MRSAASAVRTGRRPAPTRHPVAVLAATLIGIVLVAPLRAQPGATVSAPRPAPPRQNVLILFADDLRKDGVGAFGGAHDTTPHLDALAARGLAFDAAYCMGSRHGAVCIPSRAMLLSGAGLPRVKDDLAGLQTLPEIARRQGYRTHLVGKWHNGEAALLRAFPDADTVMVGGMADHFAVPLVDVRGGRIENRRVGNRHSSELFADAAIRFLDAAPENTAPFFALVAFTAPHDPRDAPPEWRDRFRKKLPPLPPNFRPQHELNLGPETMTVRDENLLPWPRPEALVREQLAEYLALVGHLDAEIGRILRALDRNGLGDRTMIVFAADQGAALGSHGLLGKQSVYEHSMGTPVVLAGPGVPAAKRTSALVYLQDLVPTLAAVLGSAPPAANEGRSLAPLLANPSASHREAIFLAYADTQRAVRDTRHKLLRFPKIDRTLLFDLVDDPHETIDLASDPAHAATLARLRALLELEQARFGDTLPWTASSLLPATIDLSGHPRSPDRWQPRWIVEKYFR